MKTKLILLSLLSALGAQAQGTAFTYQGRLNDAAGPASGTYDFQFTVRDALTNGNAVGVNPLAATLAVSNGIFTATLNPGAGVFPGADRWLEIAVRTNGAALFTTLSPVQQLTASPYAVTAGAVTGGVAAGQLAGTIPLAQLPAAVVTNGASGLNLSGTLTGHGANLTALNASQLASGTVPAAALGNTWRIGGNAGATPGANFLGTTDNQPLELKVNGTRALRLEPNPSGGPNVIGGSSNNFAAAGVVGATIGGGGAGNVGGLAYTNRVGANFGTVSGGGQNTIQTNADFATLGGGTRNTVQTNATYATLGGGFQNTVGSYASYATLGGGTLNEIGLGAVLATIDGGSANVIGQDASYTTIGGGSQNTIQRSSVYTTIGGGLGNQIALSTAYATIAGGNANTIQTLANSSTIGGGNQNTNLANADYATIPGGLKNTAGNYAFAGGAPARRHSRAESALARPPSGAHVRLDL